MNSAILRTIRCGRSTASSIGCEDSVVQDFERSAKVWSLDGGSVKNPGQWKTAEARGGWKPRLAEPGQNRREVHVPIEVIGPAIHRP